MSSLSCRLCGPIAAILLFTSLSVGAESVSVPLPENDPKWDWIRLDTGECLKGELRVMYEKEVEFDSDHFGIITIDWDDIAEIRTARIQAVRTNDRSSVVGKMVADKKEVRLVSGEETEVIPRNQVVSIAAGQPKESNYWTMKGSVGANVRTGNVEQFDFSAKATIQRRTARSRMYWDYNGNYSTSEEIEIANNHRTNAYFDYFFSRRFFVRPISAEYVRDPFQNIYKKQTYSASLGYTLVDRNKLAIDITGGPSRQYTEYVQVGEGEEASRSANGGIITTTVDWEVTGWMDFIGTYRVQGAPESQGGWSSYADSTFEIEITKYFDLNFSFIWERVQNPVADDIGNVPEQDDFKIIFGIGLDL